MEKSGSKAINNFKPLKGKCRIVHHSSKKAQCHEILYDRFFNYNKTNLRFCKVIDGINVFLFGSVGGVYNPNIFFYWHFDCSNEINL